VLPDRVDSATDVAHESAFQDNLAVMRNDIDSGKAVLVLFDDGANVGKNVPDFIAGLSLVFKAQSDSIYSKP
jgi:hypothetical protein